MTNLTYKTTAIFTNFLYLTIPNRVLFWYISKKWIRLFFFHKYFPSYYYYYYYKFSRRRQCTPDKREKTSWIFFFSSLGASFIEKTDITVVEYFTASPPWSLIVSHTVPCDTVHRGEGDAFGLTGCELNGRKKK